MTVVIDGTLGVTTPSETITGGTANGVAYLNGSKVLTTGSALVFDGSNLGLGVTPSAWFASNNLKALQFGGGSVVSYLNNQVWLASNYYLNSAGQDTYVGTGAANRLIMDGAYKFFTASSGTAGNAISFTQAMTLDASGNLALGLTSNTNGSRLIVRGGSATGGYNNTFSAADSTVQIISNEMDTTKWYPTFNIALVRQNLGGGNGGFGGIGFSTIDDSNNVGMDDAGRIAIVNENPAAVASGTAMAFYTQVGSSTRTNPAQERARIDSSGNLLVGTTSLGGVGGVTFQVNYSGGATQQVFNRTSAGGTNSAPIIFRDGGTQVGYIQYDNTSTTYGTGSDYRLKNTVEPMQNALAKVALLKPCTYKWNADDSDGQGFIAHELAEVVPDCVTGEKDAVDAEGKPVYQGIDTSFLVATLTAAIQEQQAIIQAQAADIAALKEKVGI